MDNILTYDMVTSTTEALISEKGRNFCYNAEGETSGCFYAPVPLVQKIALENDADDMVYSASSVTADSAKQETGCLIGEILNRNGLLTDKIRMSGNRISTLIDLGYVKVDTPETRLLLLRMQAAQDMRRSWGDAYDIGISSLTSF